MQVDDPGAVLHQLDPSGVDPWDAEFQGDSYEVEAAPGLVAPFQTTAWQAAHFLLGN